MNPQDFLLRTNAELLAFAREMVSQPEKKAYIDKTYKALLKLTPGNKLIIGNIVTTQNLPVFYKCTCLFISEHPNDNYVFSNDYKLLMKR